MGPVNRTKHPARALAGKTPPRPIARTVRFGPFDLHLVGHGNAQTIVVFALRLLLVLGFWLALGLAAARLIGWHP
jgi:hypothetical protein